MNIDKFTMKKTFLISFVLTCLFSSCQSSNVDWKEKFVQAQEETNAWWANAFMDPEGTSDDPHYINAINLLDDIIENSPEYRNKSLLHKSTLLSQVCKYDEAIEAVKQVPDTFFVYMPGRTKSIWVNDILRQKAQHQGDETSGLAYKKKIMDEMEEHLEQRRDSLYASICSEEGVSFYPIKDINVTLLVFYLQEVEEYGDELVNATIQRLEDENPCPNQHSEAFFVNLRNLFNDDIHW